MKNFPKKFLILFFSSVLIFNLLAFAKNHTSSREKTPPKIRLKLYNDFVNMKQESLFKNLKWQFIGPTNISGRMTDIAVITPKGKNYTIFAATASGGVWKTDNEGISWKPVFENGISTSIGNIEIAPSNHNIIWIGTGEANILRSSQAGGGVYKSTDGGKTWKYMGLTDTNTISRIIIHPTNPNIVYVAASGHEWTNNKARGVYKTTDGGVHWKKILYVNDMTGAIDLIMDPKNPERLYAAFWQRIRKKWNDPRNEENYKWSGIYKTTDGGIHWKPINNGLPEAKYRGRIGIDLCKDKPNIIYAFVDNYKIYRKWRKEEIDAYGKPGKGMIRGATIYRSDDYGEHWKEVSENNKYMRHLANTYGWVFGQIRVDPKNENKIYVMGLSLNVSEDGGKTFRPLPGMHGDHHGLWIDPDNTDYLVNVNDGGIAVSYDGGKNWRTFENKIPVSQFFDVSYDMATPFHVIGSIQDHGSYAGVVDLSKGRDNIPATKWIQAPGGEGSTHAIDYENNRIVYSAGFYGHITKTDIKTRKTTNIYPKKGEKEKPFRGQWLAPILISPHNPKIVYLGLNYLFRSMYMGDKWEKISPDLTYNNPKKIGDIPYQTIFTISESPFKFGVIYAGTDDGRLWITKDYGNHWKEISKGLIPHKWISRVIASKYNPSTVYVTQNGKRDDDFLPYIFKSTDYGRTWKSITNNIPIGPVNVIKEDPVNKNILYVGTDYGVFVSLNNGKYWQRLSGNLPTVYVHDLIIHPRDNIMVIATHGRGMYALDVKYIQDLTDDILKKDIYIFKPEKAKLPRNYYGFYWFGGKPATLCFYLKRAGKAKIKFINSKNKIEKTIKIRGDKGLNFIKWDLKKDNPSKNNPYVKEGVYTIMVNQNNIKEKSLLEVIK